MFSSLCSCFTSNSFNLVDPDPNFRAPDGHYAAHVEDKIYCGEINGNEKKAVVFQYLDQNIKDLKAFEKLVNKKRIVTIHMVNNKISAFIVHRKISDFIAKNQAEEILNKIDKNKYLLITEEVDLQAYENEETYMDVCRSYQNGFHLN